MGARYLLGYMPEQSKLYLIDKELNAGPFVQCPAPLTEEPAVSQVTPYTLHMALIEYQSAIMRKEVAP